MAMTNPSALCGQEDKHSADPTSRSFLGSPLFDEVVKSITDVIARGLGDGFRLCFRWAADDLENFHSELSQLPEYDAISRFEYDYRSGIVSLTTIALTTNDEVVRETVNKIIAICDTEATVIYEVAWSQSQQDVEYKAENYIRGTHGKVQAVVVLNVLYPNLEEVVRRKVIHSDHLEQPDGVVGLYLSDFYGPAGLPAVYCRPPARVSRFYPKKYQLEQEDHGILSSLLPQDSEELRHHLQEAECQSRKDKCQREEAECQSRKDKRQREEAECRSRKLEQRLAEL
ncbi:hypothetical protein B0H67DRAFT_594833 [Lasiosphaeris hirsuta]|uniref:Uncharacterized protein n=1 Tax=Lasiosphaeris hirsuta TaxID=260670 RepID=A0AA39ZS31_9PEZI|nr:hypothetical protein B0H67DRAFT_594833 [Lasiosphaeris hirsuta]